MSFNDFPDDALSSPAFQPSEADLLVGAGQYASFTSKFLIGELLMYGVYIVLVLLAVYTIVTRPRRTARTYWLLTALVITFSVATILCSMDVAALLILYQTVFIDGTSPVQQRLQSYIDWYTRYQLQPLGYWMGSAGDMGFLYIISDILASWRAMTIWQAGSRRILGLMQGFFIFSSFALWVTCAVIASTKETAISEWNGLPEHELGVVVHNLIVASSTASVAANLIATSMIGYTAYDYRRNAGPSKNQGIQGVKILALLTESGLLYAVMQIIRLALIATPSEALDFAIATCVFQSATQIVTAMYTPALILLIHYGYSMNAGTQLENLESGNSSGSGENASARKHHTSTSIHFRQPAGSGEYAKHSLISGRSTDSNGVETLDSTESSLHSTGDVSELKSRAGIAI